MKQLGILVPILLLMGVEITCGLAAAAQLTADQQVQPPIAAVGETAMVTVMLSCSGDGGVQVMVTPGFTPGIMADSGAQMADLYPGSPQIISYPIRAENSGSYWITTLISYTDEGVVRRLSKESPFTVMGGPSGPPEPPSGVSTPIVPAPIISKPEGNDSGPSVQAPPPPVDTTVPSVPAPSVNGSV